MFCTSSGHAHQGAHVQSSTRFPVPCADRESIERFKNRQAGHPWSPPILTCDYHFWCTRKWNLLNKSRWNRCAVLWEYVWRHKCFSEAVLSGLWGNTLRFEKLEYRSTCSLFLRKHNIKCIELMFTDWYRCLNIACPFKTLKKAPKWCCIFARVVF